MLLSCNKSLKCNGFTTSIIEPNNGLVGGWWGHDWVQESDRILILRILILFSIFFLLNLKMFEERRVGRLFCDDDGVSIRQRYR